MPPPPCWPAPPLAAADTVKVFLLAGQSNMEGKVQRELIDHQASDLYKAAKELYPAWRKNFEEWKKVGSDRGNHCLGGAIRHLRMGHAFAEAMLGLMNK